MRTQAAGQRGRERRGGGGESGHRDPAGGLALLRGQVRLGLFHLGQDSLGVRGEADTRVGELGRPRGPVERITPASRSRAASCWDTADGVYPRAAAVAAIVPRPANSLSSRSRRRSSISSSYPPQQL